MLKIRLRRDGTKKKPFYHLVVSDSRSTPRSGFLEQLGHYDPRAEPVRLEVQKERAEYWLKQGAQASPAVAKLLKRAS